MNLRRVFADERFSQPDNIDDRSAIHRNDLATEAQRTQRKFWGLTAKVNDLLRLLIMSLLQFVNGFNYFWQVHFVNFDAFAYCTQ